MKIKTSFLKTCCIIVTYRPNVLEFKKNLAQFKKNFSHIVIVNNDKFFDVFKFKSHQVSVIDNHGNIGLSIALNQGIKLAKSLNYSVAALFDQDSLIPDNFNKQMLNNIKLLNKKEPHLNVAVYGSQFINKKTNKKLQVINIGFLRILTRETSQHKIYDFPSWLITSGSYIPLERFDELDYFDENLFIDYIDIEWSLRAQKKGYCCVLFNNINFQHSLGDGYVHFCGRYLYLHSPLRTYYASRNSIYLFALKHVNLNFFITDQTRNILKFCVAIILDKHRSLDSVKYFFLGYYHGIIKKMGKLEEK